MVSFQRACLSAQFLQCLRLPFQSASTSKSCPARAFKLRLCLVTFCMMIFSGVVGAATLYQCTISSGGGDQPVNYGFYVTGYPGVTLQQVTLHYSARTAGSYTFTLTAHAGTYDGPVIGSSNANVTLTGNDSEFFPITFNFPSPSVAQGSTVAFTMALVSGAGGLVFAETTTDNSCPNVQETFGVAPPLGSPSGPRGFIVTILGDLVAASIPVLSMWTLIMLAGMLGLFGVEVMRRRSVGVK